MVGSDIEKWLRLVYLNIAYRTVLVSFEVLDNTAATDCTTHNIHELRTVANGKRVLLTRMKTLDDGGGVYEVSRAQRAYQAGVHVL